MRPLSLAAALLALAGCGKGPSLVGRWSAPVGEGTLELEFKEDDAFAWTTTIRGKAIAVRGEYKRTGDALALTRKEIDVPGLAPEAVARVKAAPDFGKPLDVRLTFVSDDELSLSGLPKSVAPGAVTLKRAKG